MRGRILILLVCIPVLFFGQDIKMPAGYKILSQVKGDLDKDAVAETVIVFDTGDSTESGTAREIQIFKLINKKWTIWQRSKKAVRSSEDGGMMGDPFAGVKIDNGILSVMHDGGSSWKWNYTDSYRFQNGEFQLILYSGFFGKLCEYWASIDYNLITGKLIYKLEPEHCENNESTENHKSESETFIKKGILLNLSNRNSKEIKIVSPKNKYELYL